MSSLGRVAPKQQPIRTAPTETSETRRTQPQEPQRGQEVRQQVLSMFTADQKAVLFNTLREGALPNPMERLSHLVRDLEAGQVSLDEFADKAEVVARSVTVDGKTVNLPSPSQRMEAMREALADGRLSERELGAYADLKSVESDGDCSLVEAGETAASRFLEAAMESRAGNDDLEAVKQMATAAADAELSEDAMDVSLLFALDAPEVPELLAQDYASYFSEEPASLIEEGPVFVEQLEQEIPEVAQQRVADPTAGRASASKGSESELHHSEDVSSSSSSMPEEAGNRQSNYAGGESAVGAGSRSSATMIPTATLPGANAQSSSATLAAAGSASRFSTANDSGTSSRSRAATTAPSTSSKTRAATASGTSSKTRAALGDGFDISDITSLDLSPTEQQLYNKLKDEDPAAAAKFKLQQKLAKIAELAALLSNIAKMRHDSAMAIIGNMKS